MGQNVLGIESRVTWATPGSFTTVNFPCAEDGSNCGPSTQRYIDPSDDPFAIQKRLQRYSKE